MRSFRWRFSSFFVDGAAAAASTVMRIVAMCQRNFDVFFLDLFHVITQLGVRWKNKIQMERLQSNLN